MYAVLMILLMAAVIYVYVKRSAAPDVMTPLLYGLVAVVIVLSVGRLFRPSRPAANVQATIAIQESFEQAEAYMLGQTVAEDFPEGSTVLIVHGGQTQPVLRNRVNALVEAFRQGLGRKQMTLHLDGPVFEGGEEELFVEEIVLSEVELQRMLQQVDAVDVVVSLIGAPLYRRSPPPGTLPPMYVMGGSADPEREIDIALQRGIIRAAVAFHDDENMDWAALPERGMSREEIFNLRYRIRRAQR